MRTISTAALAVLVIAALFWGNCFSCPKLLFAQSAHGCCKRTKVSCDTQSLKDYVKSEIATDIAPAILPSITIPLPEFQTTETRPQTPAITTFTGPPITPLRV
jgi:hypothetical protein